MEGQNGLRVMQGDCVQGLLGVFWGDGLDVEFFELGSDTGVGQSLMRQVPCWVLGNAMTSRRESAPDSNMASLSSPKAMPP